MHAKRFVFLVFIFSVIFLCGGCTLLQELGPGTAISPESKLTTSFNELLVLHKEQRFEAIPEFARQRGVVLSPIEKSDFLVNVEMKVTKEGAKLVPERILKRQGRILSTYGHLIHAQVPLSYLRDLASMREVRSVYRPDISVPDAVSEGLTDIQANLWQAAGFDGSGIKVAILDGWFEGYANRQAAGDLPTTVTTSAFGYTSFTACLTSLDHGTECAEIVHDVVPGADLYLVCYDSETDFLNAVDYLIDEGVDVISHSLSAFRGPHNGTSRRSKKIDEARAHNIVWVNSAGNRAQQHWEGYFNDDGGGHHIWNGTDTLQSINLDIGNRVKISLVWNDWGVDEDGHPGGNVDSQDYKINLYKDGVLVISEDDDQEANDATDPYEYLHYIAPSAGVYEIEVESVHATGAPEYLDLFVVGANIEHQVIAGSVPLFADAVGSITVGAVTTGGNLLQDYSGRGPTNGVGGGEPDGTSRIKPDLVGPTDVTTWDGRFGGTSAPTPHVAGAAALVRQRIGLLDPDDMATWLDHHADLLTYSGENNDIGNGLARLCLLRNSSANNGLDDWRARGSSTVSRLDDGPYFVLGIEGSYLVQDIDLSHMAAEIDAGRIQVEIGASMKVHFVGVREGYPYVYGYLIGTATNPNRINTYMTTGRVMETLWTYADTSYPVPPHTRKIRIFLKRSSVAGVGDSNTAYFDDVCVHLNR